jgi:RimJ/RimL family protein N-acetyltransferase
VSEQAGNYHLRLVQISDRGQLLEWANDPVARWAFFDRKMISPGEHEEWFESKLSDPNSRIWILERGKLACGVVRVNRRLNDVELSYQVASSYRGLGIAVEMLRLSMVELVAIWPGISVIACSRSDNTASVRTLERAGFECFRQGQGQIWFRKALTQGG